MIEATKKRTILKKAKTGLTVRSIEIKEEAKNVMFWLKKDISKGWKHIALMDFVKYLRKSDVSENSRVYYGRFLRNGLYERHCYISKSRSDVQCLEVC